VAARILAQATLEPSAFDGSFIVTVTGKLEGGDDLEGRVYEIGAAEEAEAAMAGIDRYVREMS
jgi:hypothetical protein